MTTKTRPRVFVPNPTVVETVDIPEPEKPSEDYKDEFPLMNSSVSIPTIVETYETITLNLPQSIYEEYKKTAAKSEMSVEDLMQHRLSACKNHNALRGLWFSDSERGQLENLLQKWPLESAAQVLKLLVKHNTVIINGEEITLTPAQKRVLSLAMFGGRTPKTFFESMIRKELRT